jgi:hypothetical protein
VVAFALNRTKEVDMIRINHRIASLLMAGALVAGMPAAQALDEQRYGETAYITGGVGEDEQLTLKDRASQYTLRVMIARKGSGEFLSDCKLTVTRGTTTALEATMDGPFLLARLAPGTYRLRAEFEGKIQERQVTIGARGGMTDVNLHWD